MPIKNRSLLLHAAAAGFFGAFVIVWFYLGLPYNFSADLPAHDTALKHFSYSDLLRYTINPLTPAWFFMTEIGYLRPIYYLIVKLFFDNFGANLVPVHTAVAIGLGCLSAFFFLAAAVITRRKWIAWLIALLYVGIPTNAPMIAGYLSLDLQYLHSLVIIGALACYAALIFPAPQSRAKTISLIVGWVLLTWIAIKWKSSEKLLPFIYLTGILLKFPSLASQGGIKKPLTLLLLGLSMLLLVAPIKKFEITAQDSPEPGASSALHVYTVKDQRMFRSDPKNIWYRTFFAPGQPNPLLKISSDAMPHSLSGDLGPLLFVFFCGGMVASFWLIRFRRKERGRDSPDPLEHIFVVTTLWFLTVLASFVSGAPLEEVRYLNFALVPMMLLLAFLVRFFFDIFEARRLTRRILTGFLLLAFGIPVVQNALTLSKWVGHFAGMQYVLSEVEKTVYERVYGPLPSLLTLHYQHPELEREYEFTCWYNHPADWKERTLERIKSKGRLFILARSKDDPRLQGLQAEGVRLTGPEVFLLINARPLMFAVARELSQRGMLRKMKHQEVLLYEATLAAGADPLPAVKSS